MLKRAVKQALRAIGLEVHRTSAFPQFARPVEFTNADRRVLDFVVDNQFTMVSLERLVATINACKHAVEAGIEGDFVECGVWRGGNAIAAKLTFENYGSDKKVWLFDTFAGMTAPADQDRLTLTGAPAEETYGQMQRGDHNDWCYASLEDVRRNFKKAGAALGGVQFIKGDVEATLGDKANLPSAISVLRLDTDWYASTRTELEVLYPRLARGGSLLIDDYGCWDGSRKAVVEYFAGLGPAERPLLHYTDYTGRMGVKP